MKFVILSVLALLALSASVSEARIRGRGAWMKLPVYSEEQSNCALDFGKAYGIDEENVIYFIYGADADWNGEVTLEEAIAYLNTKDLKISEGEGYKINNGQKIDCAAEFGTMFNIPSKTVNDFFSKLDLNHDGKISSGEMSKFLNDLKNSTKSA